MNSQLLYFVTLLILVSSCKQPHELTWKKYLLWKEKNIDVIKRDKKVNDVTISMEFVPPAVAAYQEMISSGDAPNLIVYDSLFKQYQCGLHFQMTIQADATKMNLLYHNIVNEVDYKLRIETLSFHQEEFISLEGIDQKRVYPILAQYEGFQELSNTIRLHMVFAPEWFNCGVYKDDNEKITIVFDDLFWNTGLNKFTFNTQDLKQIPTIKI